MAGYYEPLVEKHRQTWTAFHANILLFCISILTLLVSLANFSGLTYDAKTAWKVLNMPSPIFDSLDLAQRPQELKGELGLSHDIWSQGPSPEVDRAWDRVTNPNKAWVTSKDMIASGKNLSVSVKVPSEEGLGDDAYPVLFDVKHKIHCLNRIRKDLYFEHYWGDTYPDGQATDLHKEHTNHCVKILLQSLVCEANTDFISYAWYDGYDHPHPDFNIERKCGDFDGIHDWVKAHELGQDQIFDFEKPIGQTTTTMTEAALRALGQSNG